MADEAAWPPPLRYASLVSTSLAAVELARAGAADGTSVLAAEQTGGRGRLGRAWASPIGNLYASFVLRPKVAATRASEIGFVAALAVADAIDHFLPGAATLKWPNDVLIGGAKISGILAERGDGADGWIVLGIGLNVGLAPDNVAAATTCLHRHGAAAGVDAVLDVLGPALHRRRRQWERHGFGPIRADWLARAHPPGEPLRVTLGATALDCRFLDLGADGALLVETEAGERRVVAGDVALASARPSALS